VAIGALVVGGLEAALGAILGIAWYAPLLGAAAVLLGAFSLGRASSGRRARGLAIAAAVCAALGVGVIALLLSYLSSLEFTF
jgi:hypothetical protein